MLIDLIENDDVSCVSSAAERPLRPCEVAAVGAAAALPCRFSLFPCQ